jgi:phage gpG-like protein
MGIEITMTGQETVVANLRLRGELLPQAIADRMFDIVTLIRDRVVALKLSGQVLRNRTGTLRRSITARVERQPGQVTGIVGVGSKAWYGKLHEYGGIYNVPASVRRSSRGNEYEVRAHSIHFRQRSFLRSTLSESQGDIRSMLEGAIKEAMGA